MSVSRSEVKTQMSGKSLAAQWLGLHTSTAGGTGSIPTWGTKIPQAAQPKQKTNKQNLKCQQGSDR